MGASGDGPRVSSQLRRDRDLLYDYLLRMTGQISRARDSLTEIDGALSGGPDHLPASADPRVLIWKTARSYCMDAWNADTTHLENAGLSALGELSPATSKGLVELDRRLRRLPGPQREPLLLRHRYGFDAQATAHVMGLPAAATESQALAGLTVLGQGMGAGRDATATYVGRLPLHPQPPQSDQGTQNLSLLMRDMQHGRGRWWRWALIGLLVATVGAAAWAWREQWMNWLSPEAPSSAPVLDPDRTRPPTPKPPS